jgi:hypothetical protein
MQEISSDDKGQCAEPCYFCESHDHCSDAHPFNNLNELIDDIKIGYHIPSGISERNAQRIRNGIRQAFITYFRSQCDNSPRLVNVENY